MHFIRVLFISIALLLAFSIMPANAEVTVEPFGLAVSVEGDDVVETEITLVNDGDDDIAFSIGLEEIEERRGT